MLQRLHHPEVTNHWNRTKPTGWCYSDVPRERNVSTSSSYFRMGWKVRCSLAELHQPFPDGNTAKPDCTLCSTTLHPALRLPAHTGHAGPGGGRARRINTNNYKDGRAQDAYKEHWGLSGWSTQLVECYFTSTETVGLLGTGALSEERLEFVQLHYQPYYTNT